jgi:hypothetical protein
MIGSGWRVAGTTLLAGGQPTSIVEGRRAKAASSRESRLSRGLLASSNGRKFGPFPSLTPRMPDGPAETPSSMRGVRPFACCELPCPRGEEALSSHAHALHYTALHCKSMPSTQPVQCNAMHSGHPATMESFSRWIKTHACPLGNALCAVRPDPSPLPENEAVSIMGHGSWVMGDDPWAVGWLYGPGSCNDRRPVQVHGVMRLSKTRKPRAVGHGP